MASGRPKPHGPANRWEHVEDPVVAVLLAELDKKIEGVARTCDAVAREQTLRRTTEQSDHLALLHMEVKELSNRIRIIERRLGVGPLKIDGGS